MAIDRNTKVTYAGSPLSFFFSAEERIIESIVIGAGERINNAILHAANGHSANNTENKGLFLRSVHVDYPYFWHTPLMPKGAE